VAKLVGQTDTLGYLACTACSLERCLTLDQDMEVWDDCGWSEPCDHCGVMVGQAKLKMTAPSIAPGATTCIEHAYGTAQRLTFQIRVF